MSVPADPVGPPGPPDPVVSAARAALAGYGPFFACHVHDDDSAPRGPWRPLGELVDGPEPLRERVAAVRAHLAAGGARPAADVELRVAASVAHLGLVARLVSPLLALHAVHGAPALPALDRLRWQPELGGAFPLSLPRSALLPAGTATGEAAARLIEGPVRRLVGAAAPYSVSRRVLWGNVASAVHGAACALTTAVPGARDRVAGAAAAFLRHPQLRGAHSGAYPTGPFRRRSCCLIYRAAPRGTGRTLCGDCVLAATGPS